MLGVIITRTTVPLDNKTRIRLKKLKKSNGRESWDSLLNRLADIGQRQKAPEEMMRIFEEYPEFLEVIRDITKKEKKRILKIK